MAGSDGWENILPEGEPPKIDTTVAHPARIYDWASRTKETFARYFSGLEIVEPGLVTMGLWRPAPGAQLPPRPIPAYCGVARKP
jgi:hypothetical protein